MEIDVDRGLTRFQWRVLRVLRAAGPCTVEQLRPHFRVSPKAVRLTVWLLAEGGWVSTAPAAGGRTQYDVTAAGRAALRDSPRWPQSQPEAG